MRHIVQFLVPVLIVLALALVFLRARRNAPKASDRSEAMADGAIVLVVLIGAELALALATALNS